MATLAPVGFSATVGGIPHNIDDASIVYHTNLLIFALIAIFVLIKLPRAFALFGTSSEWLNGHFLRYVPYKPSRRLVQAVHSAYPPPTKEDYIDSSSDENHTLYSSANVHHVQRLTEKGAPVVIHYPPHITSCIKPLRPLLTPLRARILPGFSVGQLLLVLTYFYSLLYVAFYKSNILTDNARTGWIAVGQLPLLYVFAQKNNVLGSLLGFGYEKLNFLHRFAGRLVVLAANLHSLHYFYAWTLQGNFKANMNKTPRIFGMIALICMDMLFFFSTQLVRQKAYNLFLSTHIFSILMIIPALYFHKPSCLPYMLSCLAIYMFDRLMRLVKSRLTTAFVRPLPEMDVTRVEIPSINAGWRAGQHIRLRVLSLQMGWFGWMEEHPFTIASVAQAGPDGMVLMCKRAGGWTRKLYDVAKMGSYTEGGVGRDLKVVVEGPYGGPGHTIFSSFSAAVFVAGGSGITYALAALQDLVQKDLAGQSRVKVIELVWTVPDPSTLVPLLPQLTALVHQSVFTPLRISVFYTRAPTGKQPAFFAYADAPAVVAAAPTNQMPRPLGRSASGHRPAPLPLSASTQHHAPHPSSPAYFPPGLTLAPGRPKLSKIFESAIQRAVALGSSPKDEGRITGMVVGVCGPVGLGDDVAQAVNGVDPTRRDQVGGIEICEEVFGW